MTIKLTTLPERTQVHQRVLIIHGQIEGDSVRTASHITVRSLTTTYPPLTYPVSEGVFKAMVPLDPGWNTVNITANTTDTVDVNVEYVPLLQNPPIHLCILVGKDSEMKFDTPSHKSQNGIQVAIERLRLQAYLWQAFTAEQMRRYGYGRRTFRFEEEFMPDTITKDRTTQRSTIKVYVLRTEKTVKQLRQLDLAQQREGKNDENEGDENLFGITLDTLEKYGHPFNKPCYVASLILDSHWDKKQNAILAHTALGGGAGFRRLGIFGSHLVHGWPATLEELPGALLDQTPNDTNFTANDCNEIEAEYKAFCIGSGAFLHEVGHSLTLTHTPSGIMSRGFNHFNRAFMPYELNPKFGNKIGISVEKEEGAHWHPADVLRFRFHPCFALPNDPIIDRGSNVAGPTISVVSKEEIYITSGSPIVFIEWFVGDELVKVEKNNNVDNPSVKPNGIAILPGKEMKIQFNNEFIQHLRSLARRSSGNPINMAVIAANQSFVEQKNIENFIEQSFVPGLGIKSPLVGMGLSGGHHYDFMVQFNEQNKSLLSIVVYASSYVHGLQFIFEDQTSHFIGHKQGEKNIVHCPYAQQAYISQLSIKGGHWIDGLQISLDGPRGKWTSAWIGGTGGSEPQVLKSINKNNKIIGFYGSQGDFTDAIGVIYST